MVSKPDDNYESIDDVNAIREAQENIGDYKLKSADDYVVPDHLRMNTVKARARLLQLKEQVRVLRMRMSVLHLLHFCMTLYRKYCFDELYSTHCEVILNFISVCCNWGYCVDCV